jgi:hypothetical protein
MGMSKPKVTHRHTLFAELSDLSIDVCVCTAGHVVVVVIVGKLSSTLSLHLMSFSDMLDFQHSGIPSNAGYYR